MKKFLTIILISICVSTQLIGCEKNKENEYAENENSEEVIKIMENVYADYINEIYLDSSKYIGKTLEIEGMLTSEKGEDDKEHFYVYRWIESSEYSQCEETCHAEESKLAEKKCGLEFTYNKNIPREGDWIKVIGKLKEKDGDLVIEAQSVEVMKERGIEKVKFFY